MQELTVNQGDAVLSWEETEGNLYGRLEKGVSFSQKNWGSN